jgi:hypothetical protein
MSCLLRVLLDGIEIKPSILHDLTSSTSICFQDSDDATSRLICNGLFERPDHDANYNRRKN